MTDKSDKGLKAKVEAHNAKSKHKVTVGMLLRVVSGVEVEVDGWFITSLCRS